MQGNANGDLATTQFSRPNGITVSADGTSFFVGSVSPQNYIKEIHLAAATGRELPKPLLEIVDLRQDYLEVPGLGRMVRASARPVQASRQLLYQRDLVDKPSLRMAASPPPASPPHAQAC